MSRYARARRQRVTLPPGVEEPRIWLKDAGPVRVESKVWLANQRTFIKWQHVSVLLATLSLGLYNAAGKDNDIARTLAIVYTCFALFAALWGWHMYEFRSKLIRQRSGRDLDNVLGPIIVCIGLAMALVLNFGFKVCIVPGSREFACGISNAICSMPLCARNSRVNPLHPLHLLMRRLLFLTIHLLGDCLIRLPKGSRDNGFHVL